MHHGYLCREVNVFIARWFSQDSSRNKSSKPSVDSGDCGSMLAGLTEVSLYSECLLAVFTLTSDYLAVHIQLSAPEVTEVLLRGPSPLRIHWCFNRHISIRQLVSAKDSASKLIM